MRIFKKYFGDHDLDYILLVKELIKILWDLKKDKNQIHSLTMKCLKTLRTDHYEEDLMPFFYEQIIFLRLDNGEKFEDILEFIHEDLVVSET